MDAYIHVIYIFIFLCTRNVSNPSYFFIIKKHQSMMELADTLSTPA
jgi:hypothetical protein